MVMTGYLRDDREAVNFEWKIPNFPQLSYEASARLESPKFSFCSELWKIKMYQYEGILDKSTRSIGLFVSPTSLNVPISVDYSFQLKTVDGKADADAKFTDTHIFDKVNYSWGSQTFTSRSKLIERQSELLPSGVLTVICTLKKTGTNDGASVLKLQQHFKEILENGNVSDVVLKVKDREFKSHRCVLAARSPVFLAMMTHDTKEKNTGVVDIQDLEPTAFADFLRFVYTGNTEIITPENVAKLYAIADKYQVDELTKNCLNYMLRNISVDNFCDILSVSLIHDEEELTDACSQFYIENTAALISTPMWLTFLKENPVVCNKLQLKQLKKSMNNKNKS